MSKKIQNEVVGWCLKCLSQIDTKGGGLILKCVKSPIDSKRKDGTYKNCLSIDVFCSNKDSKLGDILSPDDYAKSLIIVDGKFVFDEKEYEGKYYPQISINATHVEKYVKSAN